MPRPLAQKLVYTFPGMMEQIEPHYFRHAVLRRSGAAEATLYIAGPRSVKVWLNGQIGRAGRERHLVAAGDACLCYAGGEVSARRERTPLQSRPCADAA